MIVLRLAGGRVLHLGVYGGAWSSRCNVLNQDTEWVPNGHPWVREERTRYGRSHPRYAEVLTPAEVPQLPVCRNCLRRVLDDAREATALAEWAEKMAS